MRSLASLACSVALAAAIAVLALSSSSARAQVTLAGELVPILNVRGPFQHVVIGASTVAPAGATVDPSNAILDLPTGSTAALGALFWWGSGAAPDTAVSFTLPDGTTLDLNVPAADCFGIGTIYWQCFADIGAQMQLVPDLDGVYSMSGVTVDVGGGFVGNNGVASNTFAGAWALALLFVDPSDTNARVVQIANGLLATQFVGIDATVSALPPFEMSNNGGQATIVAIESDAEFPGAGECSGGVEEVTRRLTDINRDGFADACINNADCPGILNFCNGGFCRFDAADCDFFALCEDTCISNLNILPLTASDVLVSLDSGLNTQPNPRGNLFNETASTELAGQVTGVAGDELNGIDIDTFNLQGRLPNGVYDDAAGTGLRIGVQSGGDLVIMTLVVISIEDFDRDLDGLSNFQEDEIGTDQNNPDTDGDGVRDGPEFFGGQPGDPSNNPTNPLNPDSDADGLCDGANSVGACTGGEDLNNDGLRAANETDPNLADTDGDLLSDGLEVLTGNYLGCAAGCFDDDGNRPGFQTDPLNRDTDGDGLDDGVEDSNTNGVFEPARNETDPTNPDTDAGGESDGSERENGRNPVDFPIDDNGNLGNDDDGDGLANGQEDVDNDGVVDPGETDPQNPDTDGDGLGDGVEVNGQNDTDPLDPDTDADGILDGTEDQNQNGSTETGELNPTDPDTDDDLIEDGVEDANQNGVNDVGETDGANPDTDGDGLGDGVEDADQDGTGDLGETSPLDPDSDDDGLDDGIEVNSDFDGSVDADPDRDGSQTDPLNPDTDGDGLDDGQEDFNHDGNLDGGESDPTDPDDPTPTGEGEGEGEGEPIDDGIDDTTPEIEKFISGSALYTCASGGAGAPLVGALIALLALRSRRSRAR